MPLVIKDLSGNGQGVKRGIVTKLHTSGKAFELSFSDTVNETRVFRAIRNAGTTVGNIAVVHVDDTVEVVNNVLAGDTVEIQGIRVNSTDTTITAAEGLV